jgi:hypothetical protein
MEVGFALELELQQVAVIQWEDLSADYRLNLPCNFRHLTK